MPTASQVPGAQTGGPVLDVLSHYPGNESKSIPMDGGEPGEHRVLVPVVKQYWRMQNEEKGYG